MAPATSVIVTARNEAAHIEATLAALARAFPSARVFLADDGSRDGTAELASRAGARIVRAERPLGKGGAATVAARAALAERPASLGEEGKGEEIFVLCDGDLADSAVELRRLEEVVVGGGADIAVGAFAAPVGGGFGLARSFARWAIRRRCGLETRAPISGQRALRAGVLEDLLPFAHGYGMEVGMTIDAVRAGHRVVEVELDLEHRASWRTPAGFAHRGRQLLDFVRVYLARSRLARR
jgi:glycosyltransferase involved in cell wall biosynthesis